MSSTMKDDDGELRDEALHRALLNAPDHTAAPNWRAAQGDPRPCARRGGAFCGGGRAGSGGAAVVAAPARPGRAGQWCAHALERRLRDRAGRRAGDRALAARACARRAARQRGAGQRARAAQRSACSAGIPATGRACAGARTAASGGGARAAIEPGHRAAGRLLCRRRRRTSADGPGEGAHAPRVRRSVLRPRPHPRSSRAGKPTRPRCPDRPPQRRRRSRKKEAAAPAAPARPLRRPVAADRRRRSRPRAPPSPRAKGAPLRRRAAAPPAPTASPEPPSFSALSQWSRITITQRGGASRTLSRSEAQDLAPCWDRPRSRRSARSRWRARPNGGVTLERSNGDVMATFELGRNQVRWREGRGAAATGMPSASSLAALREALQQRGGAAGAAIVTAPVAVQAAAAARARAAPAAPSR